MKRIVCALLLMLCLAGCTPKGQNNTPVEMMFATDLHMISPTLAENEELFMQALKNGDGKITHKSEQVADALFAQAAEKKPDYLILAGDNTFNGAVESHGLLIEKLTALEAAGVNVLLIPGNHDVDSRSAFHFGAEGVEYATALSSQEFMEQYAAFGPDLAVSRDESTFSYLVQTPADLRILMLDSNCFGIGTVKDSTLSWMEEQLKQAQKDKAPVMAVMHQNLYAHSNLLSFGYQLYNASQVQELFETYGVKVCFSGHIHLQSIQKDTATEVVTTSLTMAPVQYGAISYKAGTLDYRTERLSDFADFATAFFEDISRSQVQTALKESGMPQEDIDLLAETFAKVNTAYFAGTKTDFDRLDEGMALWRAQEDSFFLRYMESMLSAESLQRQSLSLKLR